MIPLAMKLREMNNTIYIGAGEDMLPFFKTELRDFNFINFRGFRTVYSRDLPQYLFLLLKIPVLIYHSVAEHFRLKRIIREYSIDLVISDNRFGLWNKKVRSVYVTHMPLIPFPRPFRFLEFTGISIHRLIIRRYALCLIPDLPGEINLSGRLTHNLKLPSNTRYVGILSRFTFPSEPASEKQYHTPFTTIILSGPEPQRSILMQKLTDELKYKALSIAILGGQPDLSYEPVTSENIISYNHLPAARMKDLIINSEGIIARSGYTTIMELISLGCTALLIPTPGQTEQEYLAEYLTKKGWVASIPQNQINRSMSIPVNKPVIHEEILKQSEELLEIALKEMLEEKKN